MTSLKHVFKTLIGPPRPGKPAVTTITATAKQPRITIPVTRPLSGSITSTANNTTIKNCTFVNNSTNSTATAIRITNSSTNTGRWTNISTTATDYYDAFYDTDTFQTKELNSEEVLRALSSGIIDIQMTGICRITPGAELNLPDGSKIYVKGDGNFEVLDDEAKITYKGNRNREFNKHINASDLLEQFISDLGKVGIKQNQVLKVPIEAFINWLIHKAAEQDGDPPPTEVKLIEGPIQPRCKHCGRYIKHDLPAQFCNGDHYQQYIEKKC